MREPFKNPQEAIDSLNMERQVGTIFDNFGLIVVGYSGGDKTVMDLLNNVSPDRGLYWCHRKDEMPGDDVLQLLARRRNGKLVEIEGFDALMGEISEITGFKIKELEKSLEARKEKLKASFIEFKSKYGKDAIEEYEEELKEKIDEKEEKDLSAVDYFILGNGANYDGHFDSAETYYRKAIEINKAYLEAYTNLGSLLAEDEKRLEEAEDAYNKAIEIDPNDAVVNSNLGNLLAQDEKRLEEAEDALNKAIEINPNYSRAYHNLGILLAKDEKRWGEAEDAYYNAIVINPNHASAYFNLACLRSISGLEENKDEAFEFLKKATELDSGFVEIAKNDADFDFIRDDERFKEIVGE